MVRLFSGRDLGEPRCRISSGMGEKKLVQLVTQGLVHSVADLYDLTPDHLENYGRWARS